MSERRGKVVEIMAIKYPIPDDHRKRLIEVGEAAVNARIKAGRSVENTEEGYAMLGFEASLRKLIGVPFSRPEFLVNQGAIKP